MEKHKILHCIDPGPRTSGYAKMRITPEGVLVDQAVSAFDNEAFIGTPLVAPHEVDSSWAVIEGIQNSYGHSVGRDVMDTVWWAGRFYQFFLGLNLPTGRPTRQQVLRSFFGQVPKGSDSKVREFLLDRFGGKSVAIGKKKTPGPLYSVTGHAWQALGLGYYMARDVLQWRAPGLR
jgi:hypothetical protein